MPIESFGLNLEMNILIASMDNFRRERVAPFALILFYPSPPFIDPEISRQITALREVSSRSAPSLLLFKKRAR